MSEINPIQALKMLNAAFGGDDGVLNTDEEKAKKKEFMSIFSQAGGDIQKDFADFVKDYVGDDGKLSKAEAEEMLNDLKIAAGINTTPAEKTKETPAAEATAQPAAEETAQPAAEETAQPADEEAEEVDNRSYEEILADEAKELRNGATHIAEEAQQEALQAQRAADEAKAARELADEAAKKAEAASSHPAVKAIDNKTKTGFMALISDNKNDEIKNMNAAQVAKLVSDNYDEVYKAITNGGNNDAATGAIMRKLNEAAKELGITNVLHFDKGFTYDSVEMGEDNLEKYSDGDIGDGLSNSLGIGKFESYSLLKDLANEITSKARKNAMEEEKNRLDKSLKAGGAELRATEQKAIADEVALSAQKAAEEATQAEQKAAEAAKIPAVPADTENEQVRNAYEYLSGVIVGGVKGRSVEELQNLLNDETNHIEGLYDDNGELHEGIDEDDLESAHKVENSLELYIAYRTGDKHQIDLFTSPEDKPKADAAPKAEVKKLDPNSPKLIKNGNVVLEYQYAPIKNITINMKDEADRKELSKAIEGAAQVMPRTETNGLNMDAVRNMTLQEIVQHIKDAEYSKSLNEEGDDSTPQDNAIAAFTALRDVVMKHGNALGDGRLRYDTPAKEEEETGVVSATGEALATGAKFLNDHVVRVGDARKGAKNAGKRVEAQYKVNGPVSGIISTVGNTAALGTTAASGIIGTVTDAGEALTDAVDNMEEGAAKDAAKTASGAVKAVDGVLNLGAAAVDGISSIAKEGFYINRLWGGKGNDEAIDELAKSGLDHIVETMISREQRAPLKDDATEEEKAEYAKKLEQDKIEYSYIVDVTHRLGITEEELAKMDADEVRTKIVDAVNDEKIPLAVIKAFAPERIAEKGMSELSELLNTDGQEGISKVKKAGSQIVDGVVDLGVGAANTVDNIAGGLIGKGWLWGKAGLVKSFIPDDEKVDDAKATGAAAPVHTASTKELTQAERDKKLEEWKADFMPKFEANKEKVLDAIIPPEFISSAIEETMEELYTTEELESLTLEQLDEAKNNIKRQMYEALGEQLKGKFSEYEAHRLFTRAMNDGEYGEDTFWANFWNEIDNAKAQENTAGDRGFWKNFGSYLYGAAKFPATAVLTDAPYTIAGVAGGVPFWKYQVAFSLFLGSEEHVRGTKNIIEGKYNSAQKAAGWDENGYATIKDIVVWWNKHHHHKKIEKPCECKPKPKPEETPDEIFIKDPGRFTLGGE